MVKSKVTNAKLILAVVRSRRDGKMNEALCELLTTMVRGAAHRRGFKQLTYDEDMQAYAMMTLIRCWDHVRFDKSTNVYAFYHTIITSAFIQFITREKKQDEIKEDLQNMVDEEQHF